MFPCAGKLLLQIYRILKTNTQHEQMFKIEIFLIVIYQYLCYVNKSLYENMFII